MSSSNGGGAGAPPGLEDIHLASRRAAQGGGHRPASSLSGSSAGMTGSGSGNGGTQSPSGSRENSLITIVKAQISFLLSTLTEDNITKNRNEIAGLVDTHGTDAQNHFLRRLFLACAPTQSTPPTSASGTASGSASGVLSPNNSTPNGPGKDQLPLYLRIFQAEAKRLCSDPLAVEKFAHAILSGLIDPSATVSDHFKALDLRRTVSELSLTPFETGVLLLELAKFTLPETRYGSNYSNKAGSNKRREIGLTAARLVSEEAVFQGFFSGLPSDRTVEQIAQLYGHISSWLYISESTGEGIYCFPKEGLFPIVPHDLAKAFNAAVLRLYGSEPTASILARCGKILPEETLTPQQHEDIMLATIDRFIPAVDVCTREVSHSLIEAFQSCQIAQWKDKYDFKIQLLARLYKSEKNFNVDGAEILAALDIDPVEAGHELFDLGGLNNVAINEIRNVAFFLSSFSATTASGKQLVDSLFDQALPWKSPLRQLQLIDFLIHHQSDFGTSTASASDKLISLDNFQATSADLHLEEAVINQIKEQINQVETVAWNRSQLVPTLLKLSQADMPEATFNVEAVVRSMIDRGCHMTPELVLVGITGSEKPWNPIATDLFNRLIAFFFAGEQQGGAIAFYGLLVNDRSLLVEKLKEYHTESSLHVTRILDLASTYNLIPDILDSRPYFFALDVAALAAKKEYLDLEKWLGRQVKEQGSTFVRAALEFVGLKVRHDLARQDPELAAAIEPTTVSLTAQLIATFLRALREHHEIFGPEEIELFKEVRTQCLQLFPRLMNFMPGAEQEPGIDVTTFKPEIEEEVERFYKRMYDHEISVDDVVNLLKKAKDSDNVHDHEFLACFIHGLFDEYKFFATYPEEELGVTAYLFGSLIQNHLIDYIPLGIAVRYVLDALRNPPESKWFQFGVQALVRFQSRLSEWPSFAQALLNIPHFVQVHPDLAEVARQALSAPELPENVVMDGQIEGVELAPEQPKIFTALKPDLSVKDRGIMTLPDEATSDVILFTVNNISPINLKDKVAELDNKIEEVYFRWFANYLVDQRVSIEPNNHELYMSFLDALNLRGLFKEVLQETLIRAEALLNSEETVQSSNQRTLLKNLGSWLGALTLAKDKPIKHKNVSFKDLLIEGYDSNRLIVAIPFVCKVLEQCAKSRVFKPPNPWVTSILRLLVELYQFADLKLNLKFEVEVLCKNLNIDLKQIQPTTTLRDRPPKDAIAAEGVQAAEQLEKAATGAFPTSQTAELAPPSGPGRLPAPTSGLSILGSTNTQGSAAYSHALADAVDAALAAIPQYLTFSPQVVAFSSNGTLKRLVQAGIERAVKEIIAPVVERSVTIAGISTRELTIKDFAMEGNEDRMRTGAHLMVQNLAGSLTLVTCKEPLRMSICAHIRTLMLQNGFSEQNLPEQAIMIIANDNLELACSVVEKVAMDRAVVEVDDALAPSFLARRKHRERSSQAFWDTAAMAASHYSGMLPDPLRLKLGGLQPQQLRVYEDFAHRSTSSLLRPPSPSAQEAAEPDTSAGPNANVEGQAPGGLLTAQQATEFFNQLMADLEKAFNNAEAQGVTSLAGSSPDLEIHTILRQVPVIANRAYAKDEVTLTLSQRVVQLLYRTETSLAREAYVLLLQRLCDISAKVAKEVTSWLIYAPDERKYNVPVTVLLLESGFITVSEYDAQLAKFIVRDFRPSVITFAASLARECLLNERPIASREHFSHSLRALAQAAQSGQGSEQAAALLEDLRNSANIDAQHKSQLDDQAVREQLTMCFVEWVRVYQHSYQIEKAFVEFVVQLQNQGILKGEEISSLFFRVCAEVSVESYINQKAAGQTIAGGLFHQIDAFAKLITFMIKYHADPQNKNNDQAKVHYMTKVLSIVVLVLARSHEELGPYFQQKPFYRFFSSLLSNLSQIEVHLGSAYYQILVALSHSINTLQPLFFSGFTFSWMSLVSHRLFMPKLLTMKDREGWSSFHRLLVSLLRFLAPFLRKGQMSETISAIYTGTVRILLVLMHDFPEFLTLYYYSLSDVIPPSCIQLHNLISCAFPPTMKLPDPTRISSASEDMPDASVAPTLMSDFTVALQPTDLRKHLEQMLQKVVEKGTPTGLAEHLQTKGDNDSGYNLPLINSIVMFSGSVALAQAKAQKGKPAFDAAAPAVQLLKNLVGELEPEGSYYVLCSVANHLRFPNSHSNWFSSWLVHAFADAHVKEYRKEQILRVLLERMFAQRPHPYGVVFTTVQLMKIDGFFNHAFVTEHKEIQVALNRIKDSLGPAPGTTNGSA